MRNRAAATGHAMAIVWLCAITLSTSCMAGLLYLNRKPDLEAKWRKSPPFGLVIGTSLVLHAFPPEYAAKALFPEASDADLIGREAWGGLSETETVRLLQHAIDAGVKKVFVEIDPLLHIPSRPMIPEFSDRLRAAALQPLQFADHDTFDPNFYTRVYDGNTRELGIYYSAATHAPGNPASIDQALATARKRGLDVVWIAMPRSRAANNYFGSAFDTRLQDFSEVFHATIWRPAEFWPNEFFVDHSHLNAKGRARFLSELRLYLATAR